MSTGLLVAAIVAVGAAAAVVWRRTRGPNEVRRRTAERRDQSMKRVEAFVFAPLGAVIALLALSAWHPWISPIGVALGGLFLLTGIASLRDVRGRRSR
jgi:hypothetical protein